MKNALTVGVLLIAAITGGIYLRNTAAAPPTAALPSNQTDTKTQAAFGGQITLADGAVEYKSASGEWKRASVNTPIQQGDAVEVRGEGRAIITLDDGSAIRLNSNSAVTLNTLQNSSIAITNDKGAVYTRVVKAARPFTVTARGITYQSLGTAYQTVNEDTKQGVEVYHSQVKVLGASDTAILVESGNSYYVVNKADTKIEKKLAKLDGKNLEKNTFIQWNKKQDESETEFKDQLGVLGTVVVANEKSNDTSVNDTGTPDKPVRSISISSPSQGVVKWTVDGYSKNGFKVVWSKNTSPTYPTRSDDEYVYLGEPSARIALVKAFDGEGTYYVRVCEYLGGSCGVYSNQIKVTLGGGSGAVQSISLRSLGGGKVSWTTTGYSEQGYKVVWSKDPSPTYPRRSGDEYIYLSESSANQTEVNAFNEPGTYYVRVCEYLGGKCGVYSNQITVNLE